MKYSRFLAPSALVILAACGGTNQASFVENATELQALGTAASSAPLYEGQLTGKASYDGFMSVIEADATGENVGFVAIGEASVEIDFDNDNATNGSASNFSQIDIANVDFESDEEIDVTTLTGTSIDGDLTLTNGGNTVAGTLVHLDGEAATYNLDVTDSEFRGAGGEYMFVEMEGTSQAAERSVRDAGASFVGQNTSN